MFWGNVPCEALVAGLPRLGGAAFPAGAWTYVQHTGGGGGSDPSFAFHDASDP